MENRKGSGIFLGVIGVATLIVAIIGATFAYFSASAQSNNDAIRVESTELALGYDDDPNGLKTDLIPAYQRYALYAGTNAEWIADEKQCLDDNGNEICGSYEFTIGNPSFTTSMEITGKVTVTTNEFENLWFAIYDETNAQVVAPTKFPTEVGGEVDLTEELGQTLVASSQDKNNDAYDAEHPTTYTRVDADGNTIEDTVLVAANRRTYTMIIWIEETGVDQTTDDAGKTFTAGISFETGGEAGGVTGIITAADAA